MENIFGTGKTKLIKQAFLLIQFNLTIKNRI